MTILKKEKKGNIIVYTLAKNYDDNKMENNMNKMLKEKNIETILDHDADVYTEEGKLLLKFRKNAMTKTNQEKFFDNIVEFAESNKTSNRGSATGSKNKHVSTNPKVMSVIFGYFDHWSPSQKVILKKKGIYPKIDVRECRFNMDFPEKYKETIPLIKEIDQLYEKLTPDEYAKQNKKAKETYFKIPQTCFTTITVNLNYQTSVHTDKGDDEEGFGNLTVIEKGKYTGGETCFPQYGIGINVRSGDILFMDVHQPHGNLPIVKIDEDAKRMSIVCYLRKNVWLRTKNKTKKAFENHRKTMKKLRNSQ